MMLTEFDENCVQIAGSEDLRRRLMARDSEGYGYFVIEKSGDGAGDYSVPYMAINIKDDVSILNYFDAGGGVHVSQGENDDSDEMVVFHTERHMHGQRIEISRQCVIPFDVARSAMVMFFETNGSKPTNVDWAVL